MSDFLKQQKQKEYNEYVKQVTPTHSLAANMAKAFLTGGAICVVGQGILNACQGLGMDQEAAGSWTSMLLVLLSVLLTGWNLYQKLAKFGGAGTLVPITGFANSVAAPAIEGVTEKLKRTQQMEWVQRCNNIHNRAEEIVLHEMIYS